MHAIVDPIIGYGLDRFGTPVDGVHPRWWCQAVDAYFERWNAAWVDRMWSADAAGAGLLQDWFPPTASTAEVMQWFDDAISEAPRLPVLSDMVRAFLIDLPADERAQYAPGSTIHLPEEQMLARWEGTRQAWWLQGRDVIAAAIPTESRPQRCIQRFQPRVSRFFVTGPIPTLTLLANSFSAALC